MDYRTLIIEEFHRRKKRNPRYSLRQLAHDLEINVTTLSLTINNKRSLSRPSLRRLLEKLQIPESEAEDILRHPKIPDQQVTPLSLEVFGQISLWYHSAILALSHMKKNKASADWISNRLGIPIEAAEEALGLLVMHGLITILNGRMKPNFVYASTPTDVSSEEIRNYHQSNLQRAGNSLEKDPLHLRDMTAITFPVAVGDIPSIKESIKKFRRQMTKKFSSASGQQVYTLALQLFPITDQAPTEMR